MPDWETYTQLSMLPGIAPEYPLGEEFAYPDQQSEKLLATLGQVGITLPQSKEFTTHYGRIRVTREGLLDAADEATGTIQTPNHFGWAGDEHWSVHQGSEPIVDVIGYIESLSLFAVTQRPEPVLRTTPNITNMGLAEDHLILAKHIKSIDTLAPWVSKFVVILDNIIADGGGIIDVDKAHAWWDDVCAYMDGDPNFKTIWSPGDGALPAWESP